MILGILSWLLILSLSSQQQFFHQNLCFGLFVYLLLETWIYSMMLESWFPDNQGFTVPRSIKYIYAIMELIGIFSFYQCRVLSETCVSIFQRWLNSWVNSDDILVNIVHYITYMSFTYMSFWQEPWEKNFFLILLIRINCVSAKPLICTNLLDTACLVIIISSTLHWPHECSDNIKQMHISLISGFILSACVFPFSLSYLLLI